MKAWQIYQNHIHSIFMLKLHLHRRFHKLQCETIWKRIRQIEQKLWPKMLFSPLMWP